MPSHFGPNASDIAGYTYQVENFTPGALIEYMIANGDLSPAARDMSVEDALGQLAGAMAIDRYDEHSFDSGEFPKVIFWSQIEECDDEWLNNA